MGLLNSIFGSRPTVPQLPSLDFGTEQGKAVANNIANLPAIGKLADLSQAQWEKTLESSLPGYGANKGTISDRLLSLDRGDIPGDISNLVQNNAAYKSLSGGFGGSGAAKDLVGRDLGLTSLDLMDKGLAATSRWLSATRNPYDFSSMFISPTQQASFDTQERGLQFQRQYLENQIKAMPDPVTHGIWSVIHQIGMSAINGLTGNAGGPTGDPSGADKAVTNAYSTQPQFNYTPPPANTGYDYNPPSNMPQDSFNNPVSGGIDYGNGSSGWVNPNTGTPFDAAGTRNIA